MMDANAIFDAVGRLGALSVIADNRRKKIRQIRNLEAKRCGNCDLWMKSTCKPEKELKQFKSCNSIACKDFTVKHLVVEMIEKRKVELSEIEAELETYSALRRAADEI